MNVQIVHSETRVEPRFPIEFAASADGQLLRVEIEWSTLEHLLGGQITAARVEELVRRNRHAIEIAITAHLFARGMPLSRQLVLSREDLAALPVEQH
jgi:hypothetical protein